MKITAYVDSQGKISISVKDVYTKDGVEIGEYFDLQYFLQQNLYRAGSPATEENKLPWKQEIHYKFND